MGTHNRKEWTERQQNLVLLISQCDTFQKSMTYHDYFTCTTRYWGWSLLAFIVTLWKLGWQQQWWQQSKKILFCNLSLSNHPPNWKINSYTMKHQILMSLKYEEVFLSTNFFSMNLGKSYHVKNLSAFKKEKKWVFIILLIWLKHGNKFKQTFYQ